jgi:hypothetical protein
MDEIINAVANNIGETENKRNYKNYRMYKYTCPNFTVFVNKSLINIVKEENFTSSLMNSRASHAHYEQLLANKLMRCRINHDMLVQISMKYDVVADLSNIYFAIIEFRNIKKTISGSINCFCVDLATYLNFYTSPNLQFSAVYLGSSPKQPIIGVKKIFMRLLFWSGKESIPDALIVYASFKPVYPNLFKNILCYTFEEYIIINTEHEQLGLLDCYLATINANIGAPIQGLAIKSPFQCYATKIGYDLICHIDLDDEPLLKNANK